MTDTTARPQTSIDAPPDVPSVVIERDFAAPAAAVFRAHTDPDLVARWLGPRDLEMAVDRWDCRPGGEYRYVHVEDGEEHWFRGCFHDVVADRRIVQTFCYEPWPEAVSLDTLTLEQVAPDRTRLRVVSIVDSFESRDAMVASGMEVGVREGYAQLDEVLAGGAGRTSAVAP